MRIEMRSWSLAFSLAFLMLPEVRGQTLLWSDEFNTNGAPDPATWSYDVGNNDGWGNGELQTYTSEPSNVYVENGSLRITAQRDGDAFTSARIKTDDKFSFTYGTLVARIRVPDLDAGLWPAFWTMGSDFYQVGWPKAGEIDIMEMGQGLAQQEGVVNRRVVSAAHWDIFGQYATYARHLDVEEDLNNDYHEFRMEWTDTKIATYVDGKWIWEIDIGDDCPSCAELHQPHYILFNMAVGGGFTCGGTSSSSAGSSSSSGCGSSSSAGVASSDGCNTCGPEDITGPMPADLLVDWVRLYDNGFTQIHTPSPTPPPTIAVQQPQPTKRPTPFPTPRPVIPVTLAPVMPETPAPFVVPLPVTTPQPVFPVTQAPNDRQPGTGGKAGKAGSKGVSGSRSGVSGGKAGGKAKGVSGSRSGNRQPGTGKAGKGKAGKGRWSRSGTTATGTDRGTISGTTIGTSGTTTAPVVCPTTAPPTTGVTGRTAQTPLFPTQSPPVDTTSTGFEPLDDDRYDDDDEPQNSRTGPESLVAQPLFSGASSTRMNYLISLLLPGIVALGLMTGVVARW